MNGFGVVRAVLTLMLFQTSSTQKEECVSRKVSSPNVDNLPRCGLINKYSVIHFGYIGRDIHPIYYLNSTAEKLQEEGKEIVINEVRDDVLWNFTYSDGSTTKTLALDHMGIVSPTGGKPSPIARSYYMAQLGMKTSQGITWLCDGVLINLQWVLTAAHCFTLSGSTPNILRLGDYNLTDPRDPHQTYGDKFVKDYPIGDVIPHPEFNVNERYHDLALIRLPNEKPKLAHNIHPICLPWDEETDRDLVGREVALTGWGATRYGGPKTTNLQEVYLKVFNTSVCSQSYGEFRDTKMKFPNGITDETNLCVGWHEHGRDACGGASGAPIVYEKGGKYILAGIVSVGFTCGQKEFPGLYIPVNKPRYLQWIKDVAF